MQIIPQTSSFTQSHSALWAKPHWIPSPLAVSVGLPATVTRLFASLNIAWMSEGVHRFILAHHTLEVACCVHSPPFRVSILSLEGQGLNLTHSGFPVTLPSGQHRLFFCCKCQGYLWTPLHPTEPCLHDPNLPWLLLPSSLQQYH